MQKEKQELEHAQQTYNDADAWHLPIGHRAEDSLDTEGLTMASVETAIPEDNKGFQMLQKMGWKGSGLGKDGTGETLTDDFTPMLVLATLCCWRNAI